MWGLWGLWGCQQPPSSVPPPPPPPTEGPGLGFLPAKVPQSRAGPSKAHRQLWGCSARLVGDLVRGEGACCCCCTLLTRSCPAWTRSPASSPSASPCPGANSQRSVQIPAPVTLVQDEQLVISTVTIIESLFHQNICALNLMHCSSTKTGQFIIDNKYGFLC